MLRWTASEQQAGPPESHFLNTVSGTGPPESHFVNTVSGSIVIRVYGLIDDSR